MKYRELGKTGKKVSQLGFGIMRLPYLKDDSKKVDREKAYEMIEYAYNNGVNYFDTAQNYLGGESEFVLGEAVKAFRDKIFIASKVGIWHLKDSIEDIEIHLKGQLERLKTNYIDFYMIHALTDGRWKAFKEIGIIDFFEKKKREGVIRNFGFSYHGTSFFFKEILNEYNWDFTQLQFNYIDRNVQAGEEGLVHADKKGLGTIIMEPLKGGRLTDNFPVIAKKKLQDIDKSRSLAEWGLGWLWNRADIDLVLSGMSSLEQVKENIKIASRADVNMMKSSELDIINKVKDIYLSLNKVQCTMCRYCVDCPAEIYIHDIFDTYNYAFTVSLENAKRYYDTIEKTVKSCIGCMQCIERCPQGIDIPNMLKEADEYFFGLDKIKP